MADLKPRKPKYFLVPMNARYKEYHLVKLEPSDIDPEGSGRSEALEAASEGHGVEIESMQEFVEYMDTSTWDDPQEITEEAYKQLCDQRRK